MLVVLRVHIYNFQPFWAIRSAKASQIFGYTLTVLRRHHINYSALAKSNVPRSLVPTLILEYDFC